jgi:hypothetical protein
MDIHDVKNLEALVNLMAAVAVGGLVGGVIGAWILSLRSGLTRRP